MIRKAAVTLVALLAFAVAAPGCGPETIAPLPSPVDDYEPNSTNILVSSLTVEDETESEQLTAVIGIDDAVAGKGQVRIANSRRDGESSLFDCTDKGGFVATVLALPGDELSLSYIDEDQKESRAIKLAVRAFNAPQTATQVDPGDKENKQTDQAEQFGGGSDATPEAPASNARDLDGDGSDEAVIQLTLIYGDGTARLVGGANFIGPNNVLVIANQSDGGVYAATADGKGAIDQTFPAEKGDVIVLFSKNALNNSLTSPATSFVVSPGTKTVGE